MRHAVVMLLSVLLVSSGVRGQTDDNLLLWYVFDGEAGPLVSDRSGHGHDGEIHGATFVELGEGKALEFDGIDDYVSCPLTPDLMMKDAVTVEVWAKPAAFGSRETGVLARWPGFALRHGKGIRCYWYAPLPHGMAAADRLTPTDWHHLVGTFDAGKMTLFVDGELVSETESKYDELWSPRTTELWIGKDIAFFEGRIGEVRLYHAALTPFQVGKRYDRTKDVYLAEAPVPENYPEPTGDLMAHYTFDEGLGETLRDSSGNENHGAIHGAVFVKARTGYALRFDGRDDYVDCGRGPSLDLRKHVSVSAWVFPEALPGYLPGVVGKGIDSYGLCYYTDGRCFFHISGGDTCAAAQLTTGMWQHVVGTFDGKRIGVYVNGRPVGARPLQEETGIRKGLNFYIGSRAPWDGTRDNSFQGLIDEVKVHNRVLSGVEIQEAYQAGSVEYGLGIVPFVSYFEGEIVVVIDVKGIMEANRRGVAAVEIRDAGREHVLRRAEAPLSPGSTLSEVVLTAHGLEPGTYTVRGVVRDAAGETISAAQPAELVWPAKPVATPGARVLNNVVSELANTGALPASPGSVEFTNPRHGWVFFSLETDEDAGEAMELQLTSPAGIRKIRLERGPDQRALESMRQLPGGSHALAVHGSGRARVKRVVIRSIPEIVFSYYPVRPAVRAYGPYDESYMRKHVYRNVNGIVSYRYADTTAIRDRVKAWRDSGRSWFTTRFDVAKISGREYSAAQVYEYLLEDATYKTPLVDGALGSELWGGDNPALVHWSEAVRRMASDRPGKRFYPWTGALYNGPYGRGFMQALMETGSKYLYKRYLREQPTPMHARLLFQDSLSKPMQGWRQVPNGESGLVICMGNFMSAPHESHNVNPAVDYKVYMDLMYNTIANDPAFLGLGGVMEYPSILADEEYIRWAAKLWRHYCIEGKTNMLSEIHGFRYGLDHLDNPDFDDGLRGWSLELAEEGTMAGKRMRGLGWMQSRYPLAYDHGDSFLWTKRSAKGPNVASQTIRGLERGRTYSLKVYVSDYGDFCKGLSVKNRHTVSLRIEDVEMVPERCFQHVALNLFKGHTPFERGTHPCVNFHQRVFRAGGEQAKLVVSDWASDDEPGGPIGQELMLNFFELAPYLED